MKKFHFISLRRIHLTVPFNRNQPLKFEKLDKASLISKPRVDRRPFGPSSIVLLAFPVTTFGLGVWQAQRRTWKLNLIDEIESRMLTAPENLPLTRDECESLEYKRIKVKGTFDYDQTILIGPRSFIGGKSDENHGLFGSNEGIGWHVVNPFRLSDRPTERILVNRGWISDTTIRKNGVKAIGGRLQGEVELIGIPRRSERKSGYSPDIDVSSQKWNFRNIDALAEKMNTLPIFVDSCETVPGGPIGNQTIVYLRNDHFSYMVTWFTLSAITTFMWLKRYVLR